MKADLHLHTTASDGSLTPGELVALAAKEGFSVIAVSDHDSVCGVAQAQEAGEALGVSVIPAVELSCGAAKEIHILGYGIDVCDAALLDFCRARRENREARARQMCAQLAETGNPISFDRVMALARGVVGRPHVARALLEAGHVKSIKEAFERFLVPGKSGYVPKEDVKVAQAVALIHAAGGIAVLAHPMELKMGEMAMEALIGEWKTQGLDGIEVWHPSAANNHAAYLERLAGRENLLITGGSDYHGPALNDVSIGEGLDRWKTVELDIKTLYGRISCHQ